MSDAPEYLRITISIPAAFAVTRHDLPECWPDMGDIERSKWMQEKGYQAMIDAEPSLTWRSSLHYHDGTELGGDGSRDDSEARP